MKSNNLEEKHRRLKKEIQPDPVALPHSFKNMAWKSSADMLGGIVVGTAGGMLFDHLFQTAQWGLIIGFLLGSAAGLLNVYRGLCKVGYGFGKNKGS